MKYPRLLRKRDLTTPVSIQLYGESLDEYGQPIDGPSIDVMCNYQDSAKTIIDDQRRYVQITGVMLIDGDIAPDLSVISGGTVKIHGESREISQGMKARNPDGSVNYTRIELV